MSTLFDFAGLFAKAVHRLTHKTIFKSIRELMTAVPLYYIWVVLFYE